MIIYILFILLSIMTNILITYFSNIYDKWYLILIMIILIPITFILYVILYLFLITFFSLFINKKEPKKPNKFTNFLIKETSYLFIKLLNIKVIQNSNIELPKEKALIVSNHKSNLDPLIICAYIKKFPIIAVTKPENLYKPIYGKYVTKSGYIKIDRDDDIKAANAIKEASVLLKNNLANVLIFPEGKRNFNDGLLDFHHGSFKIATRYKSPTIVISLKYNKRFSFKTIFKKTIVTLNIIKVFDSNDYNGPRTNEISEKAYNLIKESLED